jgi:hypothetical protein
LDAEPVKPVNVSHHATICSLYLLCNLLFSWLDAESVKPAPGCWDGQTSTRMLGWIKQHRMLASRVHYYNPDMLTIIVLFAELGFTTSRLLKLLTPGAPVKKGTMILVSMECLEYNNKPDGILVSMECLELLQNSMLQTPNNQQETEKPTKKSNTTKNLV